ncbi:MAG: hypothetical protein AM326_07595 [Candidatus Thorarchaeota archaeon SMTZ-45]|nr:MAG: hypothetical protein AM326_07595 [Candidatus Thorarchaeota archaeon SMTZ-45]
MDIEGIVIFDAAAGIPLFSRMKTKTDPSLFSSFIAAIAHFTRELKFGGLSSFTTEEKVIYLAPRDKIITALIAPKKKEYEQAYSLADELGRRFEESGLTSEVSSTLYNEFAEVADLYLRKIQNPFISRVSEFIQEEYEGKVSIRPSLMKRDGSQGSVDLLIDAGRRDSDAGDSWGQFGENYSFVKVLDTRAGRLHVIDFIDTLDNFAVLSMQKDEMVTQPYFPTRAIIVAREYDNAAIDFLRKLPKRKGRRYVDGAYIYAGQKLKGIPKETRCVLDVWKWHDDKKPERVEI